MNEVWQAANELGTKRKRVKVEAKNQEIEEVMLNI